MVRGVEHIETVFAFIVVDPEDETEGVPAFRMSLPGEDVPYAMPLIGTDGLRVEWLRQFAQRTADEVGRPVVLAKFSNREDVETIRPSKHN